MHTAQKVTNFRNFFIEKFFSKTIHTHNLSNLNKYTHLEKSISPPHLWRVDYLPHNLWNSLHQPSNFPKPNKLPPKPI
jgi:hypothetical protein